MNSASARSEYLLIFRGTDWHRGLTPGEIKEIMIDWMAWSDGLVAEGRTKARRSLGGTGKIISGKERNVSDGPYAEAKEAVAGYFLVEVDDIEEAVAIAKQCPTLECGMTVEIRPMPPRCLASELAEAPLEAIASFIVGQDEFVLRTATAESTY